MSTVAASAIIDRTGLGLEPLTISGDGSGLYSLTPSGLPRPVKSARLEWAPPAPGIDGAELYEMAKDNSALPFEVAVLADSTAALEDALAALEDALWQSQYTVATVVDGVRTDWQAFPTVVNPASGLVLHGYAANFLEVVAFTVPIYPSPVTPA